NPDITYRDSLAQDHAGEDEKYSLVLANPPFAGSLDYENCAKDLLQVVKTKKTELLFLALFLRLLKPGGRAAVIVPDGVLFGSSKAHKQLRTMLVENQKLDAVVKLPSGVFKPYAGVSTAILLFTKTNSGGTDHVWFYDVEADGWSLDDKRQPLLASEKLGPVPSVALTEEEHAKNNLPDVLRRWRSLNPSPFMGEGSEAGEGSSLPSLAGGGQEGGESVAQTTIDRHSRAGGNPSDSSSGEGSRPRTAQSFLVPKADIVATGYDLSLNRYKEVVHEEVHYDPPKKILAELRKIEEEIEKGMKELEGMLV
ncbi:MAG TPA: N-6 DNA methylase, partial [Steroidobacteraceae bacterium]|nr:N-6 DNA methylase [Steroidobacteraceae bacterium]